MVDLLECASGDGVVCEEDRRSPAGIRGTVPTLWHPKCGQLTHCQGTVMPDWLKARRTYESITWSSCCCSWGYRLHLSIKATHDRRPHFKSDSRRLQFSWSGARCCQLEERNCINGSVWIWSSFSDKICGCNRRPGTVQSGSATATDLDPHQLRLRSLLHMWVPLCLCILWQTPPVGELGKRESSYESICYLE